MEIVKAKALARLMKELGAGDNDLVFYTEAEIYQQLGVEKE